MPKVGILSAAYVLSPSDAVRTGPELVFEVAHRAVLSSGCTRESIDLTVSGSSDVLEGRSFGFAYALEALGAYPPTLESHVEMDGAWAAYYAYLKLLAGQAKRALVVGWGKPSEASLHHVTNAQLDPFWLAPLGLDRVTSAALQADAWLEQSGRSADVLEAGVNRALERAGRNASVRSMLEREVPDEALASPLRTRHCPRTADGACAVVLAAEDAQPKERGPVAWVCGADHRSETAAIGCRDLTRLPSAIQALSRARSIAGWASELVPDVAELSAPFAHQ